MMSPEAVAIPAAATIVPRRKAIGMPGDVLPEQSVEIKRSQRIFRNVAGLGLRPLL